MRRAEIDPNHVDTWKPTKLSDIKDEINLINQDIERQDSGLQMEGGSDEEDNYSMSGGDQQDDDEEEDNDNESPDQRGDASQDQDDDF